MKTIRVELPDKLAREIESIVSNGWFSSETELIHLALLEFVRHHRFELAEQFQREDIAWALKQRETGT